MNREPVNPDDPQLTAYALGEMTLSERAEFDVKLEVSPSAKSELESMEEIMGLLSKGLKSEWCRELHEPNLEVLPSIEAGKVIAPVQFNQSRRAISAIAAAVAAMCLVGAAVFTRSGGVEVAESDAVSGASLLDVVDPLMMAGVSGVENAVHVPQLFLAEEVDDLASLNLVENLEDLNAPVDASYLDANSIVPASLGNSSGDSIRTQLPAPSRADRVDSYLPPVESGVVRYGIETGLIEGRIMNSMVSAGQSSRVFVRGYVSMDSVDSRDQALAGFRPVSMSGNPVIDSEKDLELIYNFQSIQRDLGELANSLPEGSDTRKQVEQLYERNRSALSDLKREFVR
ncbi:MAG: hypothetical protein P1U81_13810 [Verrucomicrobiales bacterium]|jgi:hypothetical protein|nr:hypothetical protein [Verrucomicrobiales bacterium]